MVKLANEALRLGHIVLALAWSGMQVVIAQLDLPSRTLGIMCPSSRRSSDLAQPQGVWVRQSSS